jgi:hypothetical protein
MKRWKKQRDGTLLCDRLKQFDIGFIRADKLPLLAQHMEAMVNFCLNELRAPKFREFFAVAPHPLVPERMMELCGEKHFGDYFQKFAEGKGWGRNVVWPGREEGGKGRRKSSVVKVSKRKVDELGGNEAPSKIDGGMRRRSASIR